MIDPAGGDARQSAFAYRFDWGMDGLGALAPAADVVVIVDVLRFTSAVTAALEGGGIVLPLPWDHADAEAFAARHDADLAGLRGNGRPSLSPTDLLAQPHVGRIVLASPNGAALSFAAREHGASRVLAGCLRNASAVARFIHRQVGRRASVAVIAAGERWSGHDGPLRPALEDLLGAGAILAALDPSGSLGEPGCSPEARAARAAFADARPRLFEALLASASGVELRGRGWDDDVATSAALDVTTVVGELIGNAFVAV